MKVTKERSARNREALVKAAAGLFKEKGFEGVRVAEICERAGLTEGALYHHFATCGELAREAMQYATDRSVASLRTLLDGRPGSLGNYLDAYLTVHHRDHRATGCTFATCAPEIKDRARGFGGPLAAGLEECLRLIERNLPANWSRPVRRQKAMVIASGLVGGLILSRATAKPDPRLSLEILRSVHGGLSAVGGLRSPAGGGTVR